jgi:hypothetical protein
MFNKFFDPSCFLVVFSTFFRVIAAATVALKFTSPYGFELPRDVAEEMVHSVICNNNIKLLSGKRTKRNSNHNVGMSNQQKCMKNDHERARKCVQDDWMGSSPHFPDKSFKRTFRITKSMVDMLVKHLAKRH